MNTTPSPSITLFATGHQSITEAITEKIRSLPDPEPTREEIDHLLHLEAAARRRAAKHCQQGKRLFKRPSIPRVILHTSEGWELVA